MTDVAAIVLTGGRSKRMGTDKASLVVDGMTMLERVRSTLAAAGVSEVTIAGPGGVVDAGSEGDEAYQGPLAGVVAGWTALRARGVHTVLVLSCDLPALSADVLRALVDDAPNHAHGVVAHDGERPQPLIAAYHSQALDAFEHAFQAGERSLRRCFDGWDLGMLRFDASVLTDADTPNDLDGFRVEWPDPDAVPGVTCS